MIDGSMLNATLAIRGQIVLDLHVLMMCTYARIHATCCLHIIFVVTFDTNLKKCVIIGCNNYCFTVHSCYRLQYVFVTN